MTDNTVGMSSTLNVKQRFKNAKDQFQDLERFQMPGNQTQRQLKDEFLTIESMVSRLDLFSENELLHEISTSYIPYIGLEYYIACLEMMLSADIINLNESNQFHGKRKSLSDAEKRFERFLESLLLFGLILSKEETEVVESVLSRKLQGFDGGVLPDDPQRRRAAKIKAFKMRKHLEERISTRVEYTDLGKGGYIAHEEETRELYVDELRLLALRTLEHLNLIYLEMLVLEAATTDSDFDYRHYHPENKNEEKKELRLEQVPGKKTPIDQVLGPKGKILQPFTITKNRSDLKRSVYGTGQTLPSMSVEEYLEYELQHGKLLKGNDQPSTDNEDSENSENELEARIWDDWKDDNPKGSGNMKSNVG